MKIQEDERGYWFGSHHHVSFGCTTAPIHLLEHGLGVRYLDQIHGYDVLNDHHFAYCGQKGDGLVTVTTKLALTIRTADCIPLHLWDRTKIGMIHAGWRGIKSGIIARAIQDFKTLDVFAIIGPSITAHNYEVDKDLYYSWLQAWPDLHQYLSQPLPRSSKRRLDLRQLVVDQLLIHGVASENIHLIQRCTYASDLPSYRRQGQAAKRLVNYIYRNQAEDTQASQVLQKSLTLNQSLLS